jgi:putative ABC transport system permease protein
MSLIKLLAEIRIAARALLVNKMRALLTMLGIVIGVAAVIAIVAIGTGATKRMQDQIASIGSNLIIILPGSTNTGGTRSGMGNAATLTLDDVDAIADECPAVTAASPEAWGRAQMVYGNSNWSTSIRGMTPPYLTIRDLKVVNGVSFTDQDVAKASKVVVLGKTVVDNLFTSGEDPVGKAVRINRVPFKVIGVLGSKGQTSMGQDQDDVILMPVTTAKKRVVGFSRYSANAIGSIVVKATDEDHLNTAIDQITGLLRQRHHIREGQDDDFDVRNLTEVFNAIQNSAKIAALFLAAIASISLLVGGIGVMNTMLISVTERTREIGLRQAVGAKTGDILMQFLIEAVVLSAVGGIIGIVIGIGLSVLVTQVAGWQTQIYFSTILMAFGFSALVGVFFGFYPARKAAMLDPIEALRYE